MKGIAHGALCGCEKCGREKFIESEDGFPSPLFPDGWVKIGSNTVFCKDCYAEYKLFLRGDDEKI